MNAARLVQEWFDHWTEGSFYRLPLAENFTHTSPYGAIKAKDQYVKLIEPKRDKFLGHKFVIHDLMHHGDKACVRYTAVVAHSRNHPSLIKL